MTEAQPPRDLPGSVVYITIAGLFVASQFALPLYKILPVAALVAIMALLAASLYLLIARFFLRSDPRVWRPDSAWYRANLAPLPADERDRQALVVRGELAPRLQLELMIMTVTGAVMGALDLSMAGMVAAAIFGALCAWLVWSLLGLRREPAED